MCWEQNGLDSLPWTRAWYSVGRYFHWCTSSHPRSDPSFLSAKGSSAPSNDTPSPSQSPKDTTAHKTTTIASTKPIPGSAEWYELRKENHKKVERKRRETINQAMDDLGAVIPGNEKNKSRILGRAVQHIKGLMEEIIGLRKQVDHYRQTTQQQMVEIAGLKAQLQAQQESSGQQEQQQQRSMQNSTPCAPPVISSWLSCHLPSHSFPIVSLSKPLLFLLSIPAVICLSHIWSTKIKLLSLFLLSLFWYCICLSWQSRMSCALPFSLGQHKSQSGMFKRRHFSKPPMLQVETSPPHHNNPISIPNVVICNSHSAAFFFL